MKKIVHIKEISEKVWGTHSHLLDLLFFQGKIEEFGKDDYEKIFKYCFFLRDPLSFFKKSAFSEKEQLDELNASLDFKFKASSHKETFDWLSKYNRTRLEKSLDDLFEDLKGYDEMMREWDWTPGEDNRDPRSATKRIATATAYKKFYNEILELQDKVKAEADDSSGGGRAGYVTSALENLGKKYSKNG